MFTLFSFDVNRTDVNWFEYKFKDLYSPTVKQFSSNSDRIIKDKNIQIPLTITLVCHCCKVNFGNWCLQETGVDYFAYN